ncbi:MAG: efflux RND transporter periplasmic adaptor subunit [Syntrophobacterales bacterium]|nr:efflux RND transporter periplasmic adaptor subunit [Syntrophobacterales bacterium]
MENVKEDKGALAERIARIRRFSGPPAEFWPAFLEESASLVEARLALLMLRAESGDSWRRLAVWPTGGLGAARGDINIRMDKVAEAASIDGFAKEEKAAPGAAKSDGVVVGIRLATDDNRTSVAVFLLEHTAGIAPEEAVTRLELIADTPSVYQLGNVVNRAKNDVVKFAEALDLMVLLNAEKRYVAAAMTFCNEIASRYRCDRVSLGWLTGAYIRMQAISHIERFEKKMVVVQSLETAMEETFDQDEEILWPRPEGSLAVTRDHEKYSREQGSQCIVSLPIRLDDKPIGVLTCERSTEPFSEEEVRGLRVLCDQAARRLEDLKRHDRWFGARMVASVREALAKLLGVEHTFAKMLGLLIAVALAVLIFGRLNYRVEAPFILKTDDVAYLPAPFDGYIHKVHVKIGDQVRKSDLLLSLDTRELLLEESTALANQNRYEREAAKASAQKALADMRVAQALEEQAQARLKLVHYHLQHAEVTAPFAGIVVEGDLKELLGAPVKKGDILFKVARIEKMYAELKVDERDVHEIAADGTGEIAFVGRPDLKFTVKVERIDPVAVTEEGKNVYLVRALLPETSSSWWRPGMSGVAKINVGKRNILWIFAHRTIDFLRILFWW